MTKGLRREALALVLVLLVWEVALAFLGSARALRMFAVDRPTADLESLAGDQPRLADGALLIPGAIDPPAVTRLSGLELEPNRRYLLALRAEAGLRFSVRLVDRQGQSTAASLQLPARGATESFTLPLGLRRVPESSRLEIWNETSSDVVIRELQFHELPSAHAYVRALVALLGPAIFVLFGLRHRRSLIEFARSGKGRRPWEALFAVAVFLACFHIFLAAPVQQILDSKFSTLASHRLITAGTLSLPQSFLPAEGESLPYQLQAVGDRVYHFYPNAVAVLNAPFVAVFDGLGMAPIGVNGIFLRHRENRILAFAAAFQAAVLCALLFLLGRLFLRPMPALAAAALFAFGTPIFSSVSRAYWSHSWALLLMAAGLYPLLSPALREKSASYVVSATLLSWSFFCRPPMALSILGLVGYVAVARGRKLLWFAIPGMAWGGLFTAYSLWTFHRLTPPYFLTSHLESGVLGAHAGYPQALLGTLFSPSRGLFVNASFLALVLILVVRYWRVLQSRSLVVTALVVLLAHWLLLSANRAWWKGPFGARLFSDVLVWFFLLAIFAGLAWARERRRRHGGGSGVLIAAFAVAVGASLFINFRGAAAKETSRWRGHSVWDWRHPQFMAGLFPRADDKPLEERIANLREGGDSEQRRRVLEAIVEDEAVPKRQVGGADLLAVGVTWDRWTLGDRPAALVATNRAGEAWAPGLRLAVWAGDGEYPITVFVQDGAELQRHRFEGRGIRDIELAPVAAESRRLYLIWADKAWSPGTQDTRALGVQLLPAAGAQQNPHAAEGSGAGGGEGVATAGD